MSYNKKCPTCGKEIGEFLYDPCDGTALRCDKCKDRRTYRVKAPSSLQSTVCAFYSLKELNDNLLYLQRKICVALNISDDQLKECQLNDEDYIGPLALERLSEYHATVDQQKRVETIFQYMKQLEEIKTSYMYSHFPGVVYRRS